MAIPIFLRKDVAVFFLNAINFELSFSFSWVDYYPPDLLHNPNHQMLIKLFLFVNFPHLH